MPNVGSTFRVSATMTDLNGDPFTPATQTVRLYEPVRSLNQTNNAPILSGSGQYYVDFTTVSADPPGLWEVIWTATDGTVSAVGKLKIFIGDPP